MFSYFLDLIYPPKCLFCQDVLSLPRKEKWVCEKCVMEVSFLEEPVCKKCGRGLAKESGMNLCRNCQEFSFAFDHGHVVFDYDLVKKAISHFKFKGVKRDGIGIARLMEAFMKQRFSEEYEKYDLLIPVPIHNRKKAKRGFNQTEIIAEELSRLTQKPWNKELLIRVKNTKPQYSLTPGQRAQNIKNAFQVTEEKEIEEKSILLIEDILTTGVTLHECAKVLYTYGAKEVGFFSFSAGTIVD